VLAWTNHLKLLNQSFWDSSSWAGPVLEIRNHIDRRALGAILVTTTGEVGAIEPEFEAVESRHDTLC